MNVIINSNLNIDATDSTNVPVLEGQDVECLSSSDDFYTRLLVSAGYQADAPPLADLLARYHGLEGRWLIASPIHWEASHNDAMITACGSQLNLSDGQAEDWFKAFSEFVEADRMSACFIDAHTWLLRCDGKPAIQSRPVHQLVNQSIMPTLQALDSSMYWQRLFTESQMFFSAHKLNDHRPGCPVNGIWLWGEGQLHRPTDRPVYCDNELMHRLASIVSTDVRLYETDATLPKKSILLFDKLSQSALETLQHQLKKHRVQWFWNDAAYLQCPKPWYTRFWR